MKQIVSWTVFCCGLLVSAAEFRTPEGVAGRADDLGGGVWRVRLADADGRFAARGAVQALAAEYLVKHKDDGLPMINYVPEEIDREIAERKLRFLGVRIDQLTEEQDRYLHSFDV